MICEFCCECKKWTNFEMLVSQDGTQYSPLSANEMYSLTNYNLGLYPQFYMLADYFNSSKYYCFSVFFRLISSAAPFEFNCSFPVKFQTE